MRYIVAIGLACALALFVGCAEGRYVDGRYRSSAEGRYGEITVEVNIARGRISDIEIVSEEETPGMLDPVRDTMIPEIIEAQTVEGVDTISGATVSSSAVLEAVGGALGAASAD